MVDPRFRKALEGKCKPRCEGRKSCGERHAPLNVITLEMLLEKHGENPCAKSSCSVCDGCPGK